MASDWLNIEGQGSEYLTLIDRLGNSPFDELVEIDLNADRCRNLYHVEGKYYVPIPEGSWRELAAYAADHMVHPADRAGYTAFVDPATLHERLVAARVPGVLSAEFRYRTVAGDWLWTRQVMVTGAQNGLPEAVVYCYIYDINVQKQRELGRAAVLSATAYRRDDLTGLLLDREFFSLARKKLPALPGQWCVIAVDIEHFKLFCDWYGQQVGHFLLAGIGEVLQRVERETGGLAGYRGQDCFSLLLPYDMDRINVLYGELQALIESQGDSVGFLPAFGICLVEKPTDSVLEMYNHAAMTAERIKGNFRNRIQVYDPETHRKDTEEYQIMAAFQRSLDNRELFFCLQPQCRVSTGCVVGAEALARWRTKDGRMIPPARFVPILEKYGMVTNLDKYIWESVCAWLRKWIDEGQTPVPVSVNVSQVDIFTIDVPGYFTALLEKYRLPARLIKIEITESAYVEDTAMIRRTAQHLRDLGFLVLMDDFGSGYSSLNMLRSLNVDVIKLDAQFLRISQSEARKGINILESIINMAKTMTIPVIVEGVETQEQINFLSDLGCRYMQGYYFYRPMSVEEFENLIRDGGNVDLRGFEFKANEQIHTRELLDENVVNDAMLNNILGPVAILRWRDAEVDVVRYNQQFYLMLGMELEELNARRFGMQRSICEEDRGKLFRMLERAATDRLNGATGVLRMLKPNGVQCWISMQLYLMEEGDAEKRFYCSAQDVTEMQYVNVDIPGGYHRCTLDGEFLYISQGFRDMVGYTNEEIREKFDNRFTNMVHRDDLEIMRRRMDAIREGRIPDGRPYRIKRKESGYIYVVNQSQLADKSGTLCFQSVAIDVSEVMKLRNQMRLLSKFSSDDVVFVRRKGDGWKYRVVIHGLEARMGLSGKAFEKLLNSGEIYRSLDAADGARMAQETYRAIAERKPFEVEFTFKRPDGAPLRLRMKTDFVSDKGSKVEYICVFREV